MKSTTLATIAMIGSLSQLAPAASDTSSLRNKCAEQQRVITALEKEIDSLHVLIAKNNAAPQKAVVSKSTAQPTSTSTRSTSSTYRISKGDSLSKVAKKHHVSLTALLAANKGVNPNKLSIGQTIYLPTTSSTPRKSSTLTPTKAQIIETLPPVIKPTTHTAHNSVAAAKQARSSTRPSTYILKSKDTLYALARTHKTTVANILELNPKLDPRRLRPGTKIYLTGTAPSKSTSHKPTTKKSIAKKASAPKKVAKKPVAKAVPKKWVAKTQTKPTTQKAAQKVAYTAKKPAVKTITLTRKTTLAEFAAKYGTTVASVNQLNNFNLDKNIILDRGSQLYVRTTHY